MSQQFFSENNVVYRFCDGKFRVDKGNSGVQKCARDRKSRHVSGFGSCFLRGQKIGHPTTLLLVSFYTITHPVKTTLS